MADIIDKKFDTCIVGMWYGIKRMSGMFFDFKRCGNLVP